jgi:hypothetical protein
MGYDAHMYRESLVADGEGVVYEEVVSAIEERGVTEVAIFGYSQGGGATWVLADSLMRNAPQINGTFTIPYTAYIDAVQHTGPDPETRRPPGSNYHANYWQPHPTGVLGLHGAPTVPAADYPLNVRTTPWGATLDHITIDDHVNVITGVTTGMHGPTQVHPAVVQLVTR